MVETLEILRPGLRFEEKTLTYGRLYMEPLERGYGMTLGNALRRILLSSIPGAAITAVRIEGVLHEFSTIPGVREDVIEILLNLKHVSVRSSSEDVRIIPVEIQKAGVVTARDLQTDSEVEFIDPNAKICTMEKGARLAMELYVEQGMGYLSSDRPRPPFLPVDALLTDAIFSPVLRVNYHVGAARVGQRTDYERLVLEVWTNGIVTPDMAVGDAAQILQTYFSHIVDNIDKSTEGLASGEPFSYEEPLLREMPLGSEEFLSRPIRDLELSIRSENCLLRGNIQTIGDLLQSSRDDLMKIRNLGKKSLLEIEERLRVTGLSLREKSEKKDKQKDLEKKTEEAADGAAETPESTEKSADQGAPEDAAQDADIADASIKDAGTKEKDADIQDPGIEDTSTDEDASTDKED